MQKLTLGEEALLNFFGALLFFLNAYIDQLLLAYQRYLLYSASILMAFNGIYHFIRYRQSI